VPHHSADEQQIFQWLTNDFESAWGSLTMRPENDLRRGNFIFALWGTPLLEWASRLCDGDPAALQALSTELHHRQPRYFLLLPAPSPYVPRDFTLPNLGDSESQPLTYLFDLIRNGQAHHYQQISGELNDGTVFGIALDGCTQGKRSTTCGRSNIRST
jgi:hypothetical protein